MLRVHALVAAAGRGTRAGLTYPKTLFSIQGVPILVRILRLVHAFDDYATVIVSPDGRGQIANSLNAYGINAELITQDAPRGMGDAVLQFRHSGKFDSAEHILLIWGDIPFVQHSTIERLITTHFQNNNDFTLVTSLVEKAYTLVSRDENGKVTGVRETREECLDTLSGERDIGVFVFRKAPVFDSLLEESLQKIGKSTGEHGFLYVIGELVSKGYRVEALPIATELDLISLNSMADVIDYI